MIAVSQINIGNTGKAKKVLLFTYKCIGLDLFLINFFMVRLICS